MIFFKKKSKKSINNYLVLFNLSDNEDNFLEAFLRGASNNQMGITTDPFLGSGGIVSAAMMQVSAGFDEPTIDDDLIQDPEISVQDFGDIVIFSMFLAPPPKGEMGPDEQDGETLFFQMECKLLS